MHVNNAEMFYPQLSSIYDAVQAAVQLPTVCSSGMRRVRLPHVVVRYYILFFYMLIDYLKLRTVLT